MVEDRRCTFQVSNARLNFVCHILMTFQVFSQVVDPLVKGWLGSMPFEFPNLVRIGLSRQSTTPSGLAAGKSVFIVESDRSRAPN